MEAVMDKSKAVGAKRDATIKSRRRWRRVTTIVISVQRRRWTMAFEGVGDVGWRSTETAMVQRGGSKTTARIELKRRMADGGCQTVVLAVVDIATVVLHQPSSTMFSTATALHHCPTSRGNKLTAAVVVTVDAKSSSSLSSSSGSGATTEETNKRDGEGCGEKRR
jgi:hypothetical protein